MYRSAEHDEWLDNYRRGWVTPKIAKERIEQAVKHCDRIKLAAHLNVMKRVKELSQS